MNFRGGGRGLFLAHPAKKLFLLFRLLTSYKNSGCFPGGRYLTREVTWVCGKSLHTLYSVVQKMAQKYTLSHKDLAKIHCFTRILKGILPHDTLSHNFLINCNTLSHNFYQKRTPCRIIFTVKEHTVERHIPSSQVWE